MSHICDLFFIFIFIFSDILLLLLIFENMQLFLDNNVDEEYEQFSNSKSSASGSSVQFSLAFASFCQLQPGVAYKSVAYKKACNTGMIWHCQLKTFIFKQFFWNINPVAIFLKDLNKLDGAVACFRLQIWHLYTKLELFGTFMFIWADRRFRTGPRIKTPPYLYVPSQLDDLATLSQIGTLLKSIPQHVNEFLKDSWVSLVRYRQN